MLERQPFLLTNLIFGGNGQSRKLNYTYWQNKHFNISYRLTKNTSYLTDTIRFTETLIIHKGLKFMFVN